MSVGTCAPPLSTGPKYQPIDDSFKPHPSTRVLWKHGILFDRGESRCPSTGTTIPVPEETGRIPLHRRSSLQQARTFINRIRQICQHAQNADPQSHPYGAPWVSDSGNMTLLEHPFVLLTRCRSEPGPGYAHFEILTPTFFKNGIYHICEGIFF